MATFPYQAPVAERRQAACAWRTRIWLPHIAATLAVADYYLTQRIGSGLSPGAFSCFRALPTDHSCAPPMLHRADIFRAALCRALYLATPGLDNRAITCPDCRCSIVPDRALPRAASFHFASCGGRGGQFLGRATNAMTAIHNSVTHALYAIANEAGCYAQLEQTSRECTEANGSMRPGDICVAMGDNSHYVDVTIAHSDLSSNARLARNSPAHPQVGADAYAKEADKFKKYGAASYDWRPEEVFVPFAMDSNGFMTESAHTFLKAVALEAKKNGGGRPQALAQWRARISAAIVWERASQLFRRQRDASLAHLTPDEIAMHPRGHALLEAP